MKYNYSKAAPCGYYKWSKGDELILWISWVIDCLIAGKHACVMKSKQEMMDHFDCYGVGDLKEYVGCKVDYNQKEKQI
jgi:hypothetical protein